VTRAERGFRISLESARRIAAALNIEFDQLSIPDEPAVGLTRTRPDPFGVRWIIHGDQFAINRKVHSSDRRAATDPLRQQLQTAIRKMAAELAESAARLSNSRTWNRLSAAAEAFCATVSGDPLSMPERLGEAYALRLRLGRFLETDTRIRGERLALDDPLDPDIHGLLVDVVQTAAPWLRGFPTIAAWDDAAAQALVPADLFKPAGDFTRIAHGQQIISDRDAAEMKLLVEGAGADHYQGQKAGNRAVGGAKNLLLVVATSLATFFPEQSLRILLIVL
jgi:hypothetical protein